MKQILNNDENIFHLFSPQFMKACKKREGYCSLPIPTNRHDSSNTVFAPIGEVPRPLLLRPERSLEEPAAGGSHQALRQLEECRQRY